MALNFAFAKCCAGPIEVPNQASSEIFIIRFVDVEVFCTKFENITS